MDNTSNLLNSLTHDDLSRIFHRIPNSPRNKKDFVARILNVGPSTDELQLCLSIVGPATGSVVSSTNISDRAGLFSGPSDSQVAVDFLDDADLHISFDSIAAQPLSSRGPYNRSWKPLKINVRSQRCQFCTAWHFVGESTTFCCNNGKCLSPKLAPYPQEMIPIFSYHKLSEISQRLNNLFTFTSIGATDGFGQGGFYNQDPPASVGAHGRTYHRLFPANQGSHPLQWYLFDDTEGRFDSANRWKVPDWIVDIVQRTLYSKNRFVSLIQQWSPVAQSSGSNIQLDVRGAQGEVAAILCMDNTTSISPRQVQILLNSDELPTFINTLSPLYEPLQYMIIFWDGALGWSPFNSTQSFNADFAGDEASFGGSDLSQIWHYRNYFLSEDRFLRLGRLAQEYAVDMFSRVQEERLRFIQQSQVQLHAAEAELMGGDYDLQDHDNIFLPSSFLGGQRWCNNQVSDALCLARWGGPPTFFITMTCNPNWPEITSVLPPSWNLHSCDVPSIAVRAFKVRLSVLFKDLRALFGTFKYRVHVIEFQKRGLPHAHIAIKVSDSYIDPFEIDSAVSACMPVNANDRLLVEQFMIHKHRGPGGSVADNDGCRLSDGSCRFHYPKPITPTTHLDPATGRVHYRRLTEADRWVVPHNIDLLRRHMCHINCEIAGTTSLFQYIYKYFYKGPDYASFCIAPDGGTVTEIQNYIKGRYLCAPEALWRIFGFHITHKNPSVDCLPVHLHGTNTHRYQFRQAPSRSKLEHYFHRPQYPLFECLTYQEYFEKFVINSHDCSYVLRDDEYWECCPPSVTASVVSLRKRGIKLTRIFSLKPRHGEVYYFRLILLRVPLRTWSDTKLVNGRLFRTFQEAAIEFGFLDTATEGMLSFEEALEMLHTPNQLRFLFAELISDGCPALPIWKNYCENMAQDFCQTMQLPLAVNEVLIQIGNVLEDRGQHLSDFGLPSPVVYTPEVAWDLHRWSLHQHDFHEHYIQMHSQMNNEQLSFLDNVLHAVVHDEPLVMFLQARAGCGKTFVVNALTYALRAQQRIVLPSASTALAAANYLGGRTAHSLYRIPVEDRCTLLQSTISPNSMRADLLRTADLHVIDEAPMANKTVAECIDELMRSLCDANQPFGGRRFIFLGDWAQIPPVIQGGTRLSIVSASLKSSHLWSSFSTAELHVPIRNATDPEFSHWVENLAHNEHPQLVPLPQHLIKKCLTRNDIVQFVFPSGILHNYAELKSRAILCPLNVQVAEYNKLLLDMLPGVEHTYYSADSIQEDGDYDDDPMADIDQLNAMRFPGIPDRELHLKVGAVCVLTRNFSIDRNLTKNTKVVVTELGRRVVVVRVLRNNEENGEDIIVLPRIDFTYYYSKKGWTIKRRQFPLRLAYASTINSAQGATLSRVGFDATHPVFTHGQLYTVFSRVRSWHDCIVRLPPEHDFVENVVYTELL